MKKVLSLIILAIMIALPIKANAALDFTGFRCGDKVYETDGTVTKTCYIIGKTTNNSTISQFTATLTLENMTLKSINATSPWTNYSQGTSLSFKASQSVSGDNFQIATLVFTVNDATQKCNVKLVPCYDDGQITCGDPVTVTESYTCKVVDGKYYGKNGNIVTESVYNSECVKNPQTGNFVPYVVIIAGLALGIGVFTISRKKNTLYKI